MSGTEIAAAVCYFLSSLVAMVFAAVYLTRSEFMPYHSEALQAQWDELDTNLQTLLLALMRSVGGAWLGVGISEGLLLWFPYRAGERWALYAIPVIGLSAALPALYATLLVRKRTQGAPPVNLIAGAIMLVIIGFILSVV